jgi:hypothetical protein
MQNNKKGLKETINIFNFGVVVGALLMGTFYLFLDGILLALRNSYMLSITQLIFGVITMFFLRYVSKLFRNKYLIKYQ